MDFREFLSPHLFERACSEQVSIAFTPQYANDYKESHIFFNLILKHFDSQIILSQMYKKYAANKPVADVCRIPQKQCPENDEE